MNNSYYSQRLWLCGIFILIISTSNAQGLLRRVTKPFRSVTNLVFPSVPITQGTINALNGQIKQLPPNIQVILSSPLIQNPPAYVRQHGPQFIEHLIPDLRDAFIQTLRANNYSINGIANATNPYFLGSVVVLRQARIAGMLTDENDCRNKTGIIAHGLLSSAGADESLASGLADSFYVCACRTVYYHSSDGHFSNDSSEIRPDGSLDNGVRMEYKDSFQANTNFYEFTIHDNSLPHSKFLVDRVGNIYIQLINNSVHKVGTLYHYPFFPYTYAYSITSESGDFVGAVIDMNGRCFRVINGEYVEAGYCEAN